MDKVQLEQLKELVKNADNGIKWKQEIISHPKRKDIYYDVVNFGNYALPFCMYQLDIPEARLPSDRSVYDMHDCLSSYIAAANPAVVLALIDRIEELEKADYLQALTALALIYSDREKDLKKRIEELEKEADWLADKLAKFCDPDHDDQCCVLCRKFCDGVTASEWREVARKAITGSKQ